MVNQMDYDVENTRYDDMQREAQCQALIDEARPAPPEDQPRYAFPLANLGHVLVEVGSRLREHYGTPAEEPPPTAANA